MFNFNPFRKVSSFALSKFLTPYFSSIDESQINVGFWKGEIKLTNLELSKNFFFLNNIDIEVLYSIIHEVKIKIPWKAINSQPIEITIKGLKLVISNALQRSKKQKKEMKEQLNKLKKEALSQYDQNLTKTEQSDTPIYLSHLIQNLMQNAKVIIEDVNVIFVYQIHDFELVKFGLTIKSFTIGKSNNNNKGEENTGNLRKNITVLKVSMFFEFYDSVHLNDKFRELESPFLDAMENMEKPEKSLNKGMQESVENHPLSKNYIINNFDFSIELKLEYTNGIIMEMVVTTGPILIFLKQRQLRHLTRAIQAILFFRSDRPEIKPGISNGTILWWKYAFKRILNEEKIPLKIKNKDLLIFYKAEKYKNLYLKLKLADSHISSKERIFLQSFEENTSLAEILSLRNLALETIANMKQKLTDDSEKQQKFAKEWFEQFKIVNPLDLLGDLKLNLSKKEEKPFKFTLNLECGRIDILIQENEMLKSLKKLHNYVTVFTEALEEKKELKDKILNHIKENFVQEISNQQRFVHNVDFKQESSNILMSNNRKKSVYNWNENINLENFFGDNSNKIKKKMLLQLTIQSLKIRYEVVDFLSNELNLSVKSIEGIDMHKLNRECNKFLDIPKGFTLFMTSNSSKLHREGFEDWLVKINLDLNLETFQMTICKPFIERINSLLQMVMFDPKKFYEDSLKKEKYEADRQNIFFNTILLEHKKVTRELNLSLNIQNINIYFPFHYSLKDNMFLIQIKDLRLYKREDQKDVKTTEKKEQVSRQSTLISTPISRNPSSFQQPIKKTLLEFNPIFLRLNCLKVMIVSDYAWEEKENLFLQNLQLLKNVGKIDEASPLNAHIENNTENLENHKATASKIILETLPISFRLEKFKTLIKIKNEEYLEIDKNIKRMHINDKEITPQTSKLSIDLPMIIVNLTISQLYTLMSLIKAWQESGPDLYKAVMDETKLSSNANKPESNRNAQKGGGKGSQMPSTQFAQRHGFIDPNINYSGCAIEEFLESFEISSMNFNCEGMNFSLFIKDYHKKEIVVENQKHTNRLFSFFVDKINFSESQMFFHTTKDIQIKKIIFQNHNCLDLDLKSVFKKTIEKKTNKDHLNEKPKFMKNAARKNSSFESNNNNDKSPEKILINRDKNEEIKENKDLESNVPQSLLREEFKKPEEDSILMKLSEELSEISKIKQVPLGLNDSKQEINNFDQFFSNPLPNKSDNNNKKNKEDEVPKLCKHCIEMDNPQKRRLIINSLNPPKDQTSQSIIFTQDNENHIKIIIKTTEKELEKFRHKKVTYSDIELKLADFIIAIDPIVNQTLRSVFDLGNSYADQRLEEFKRFMKNNGFWPDFMFRETDIQKDQQIASLKPEVADSRISIVMNSITLLFHYQRMNIYILNAKSLVFISENFNVFSSIRLSADNLSLHDTSLNAGNHTNLIMNYDKMKTSRLDCEIKLFDQNFSNIKKYSTYVGIRLINVKVIFLKRIVNEFVEYIRKHFLPSFSSEEPLPPDQSKTMNKPMEPKIPSTFKLEVLIMDSMITLYQNSISDNLLYVEFNKICVWSTGLWGMEMGDLLKTGLLDFEKGDDSLNKETDEQFYDIDEESPSHSQMMQSMSSFMKKSKYYKEKAMEGKTKRPEKLMEEGTFFYETKTFKGRELFGALNEFLDGTKSGFFPSSEEKKIENLEELSSHESQNIEEEIFKTEETNEGGNMPIKEIYRIRVEEFKILTNKDFSDDETLFAKTPKESMFVEINIEDEDFVKERLEDYPKNEETKIAWPITINIKLRKLWLYSYEPEFSLLMNILQENLGEIPITVIDPNPIDLGDNVINLFVNVIIDEALIKIYKGSRDDLKEGNRRPLFEPKPKFLYKNASSLALISLKDINYRMLMQNNGGKKMILSINKLNMSDLRLNSRLMHYNKSVLFSHISNQFNFDENTITTTTQEPASPVREMAANYENNLNLEELNQNADFSQDPDHGMEIELNFDQNPNNNQPDMLIRQNENEENKESGILPKNSSRKTVKFSTQEDKLNDEIINNHNNNNDMNNNDMNNNNLNNNILGGSDMVSSKRELKPNGQNIDKNNEETNKKEKTWKEKIKTICSRIFSCCKRKKKNKKSRTISLFDLVPNIDQNDSPTFQFKGSNSMKKKDFLVFSSQIINNRNNNEPHSGLRNFVIRDKLFKAGGQSESEGQMPESKPNDYIIHNLKSVKQPNLEDTEDDEVKYFRGEAELKLIYTSGFDNEKLIKIKLNNKNLIVLIDLLTDLIKLFMKPFDGTNIPSYIKKTPPFNNNPPMIVRVELSNIYLIMLADYNTKKDSESISALIDLNYEHKWLGDAYVGPGSIEIVVYLFLKKFCLFKTPELINDEFIRNSSENKASFQFFNLLVEQFDIKFLSNYHIAFYTEDKTLEERRKYNPKEIVSDDELISSYSEKFLNIRNPNGRKEIHLPIKKIKEIIKVITLLTDSSLLPEASNVPQNTIHVQNNPPPLMDNSLMCIEQFDLMVEQINIHILKNKVKIQYGKLIFKDFRLVGIRKNENYKIKLKGTVSIDYFNKRRMDFEPLLEPWTFLLIACQVKNDIQIVLQNDQTYENEAYFIKENKNALNLNITTAGIETILEAYKIFSYESLDENEPCKLYNKMGCILRYRNAKMQEKQKHYWLAEHRTIDIWSKFKPKKPSKLSSKSVITHTAINVLLVNKDISNIIPESQLNPIDEKPLEEENQFSARQKTSFQLTSKPINNISTIGTSTTATMKNIEKKNKKMSLKSAIEINSKINKSNNGEFIKKVSLLDNSQPEVGYLNDPTPKELEVIYETLEPPTISLNKSNNLISDQGNRDNFFIKPKKKGHQNIEGLDSEKDHKLSDYRMIKDVSLDQVGKTVYKLERINRIDQNKQNSNKNIFGIDINFDFDSLDFLSKTRKINEEGNNYMVVDVRFSPKKGYKEIFVTTSVKFLNKLNSDIEIGFYWKYKKNPLETKVIKPDHEYYIPLKYIEASTLVTFKNNRMGGFDYIHWEDDQPEECEDSNIEEKYEDDNMNPSPMTWERSAQDSPDNRRNAQLNALYKSMNLAPAGISTLIPPINISNLGSNQQLKPSNSFDNKGKNPFIDKGNSTKKEWELMREKGNSQNTNNGAIFNRVPISAEFEKHDLDKFICDKVTLGEFEQVEEHELYKKEYTKKGLLVYKNDFVVNSIHHHGKASYGNFYFILSCVKSKMETQKRYNKDREEICYETTLILLPIFKITNLTMNPLNIEYGGFANTSKKKNTKTHDEDHKYSKKTLFPKSSYGCSDIYYGEDLSFNVCLRPGNERAHNEGHVLKSRDIRIYKYEKNLHVPIKLKAKSNSNLNEIKDIREYRGKNFFLWAEFKKTSPKSREIIIFCPYLIIDETNKLMFKESSSFFNPKKFFKSDMYKNMFSMKGTINVSQNYDRQEGALKEDLYEEILEKTNITNNIIKERFKKELEVYRKIHMFSTSSKMKAIQIALKDSLKQWSKPCPLQTTEEVLTVVEASSDRDNLQQDRNKDNGNDNLINNFLNITKKRQQIVKQARKKYQFGVRILPAPQPFYRSKLIVFTPRYVIKNECDNLIAIAQYDTEHSEDDIIRIRKDQWQEFHWTDHKKKEYLVLSLCNKVTGNGYGWSGRFKIDKVQELVVKLRKNQDNEYEFTKVSINIYDNVQCIRIMNEDKDNPPYSLHNETNHEISFRHKIKVGNKRNQEEVPFTILYPGDSLNFTWEQWDDENDRILQVEIDGQVKEYPIEKTQECEPFILNPPTFKNINKQIKTHIYKKGYLQIRQSDKKKKEDYYCVLSVANQKMKLYDKDNSKKITINLKGAKIENALENEFVLRTSKSVIYQFEAKSDSEKSDWVNHIWKSILLENPEIIFVKIEPENLTKAIKFHSEGEDFLLPYRGDDEGDEQTRIRNKRKEITYTFRISNAIGISIIDSLPREIVHISVKKIELSFYSMECVNNEKQSDGAILIEKGDTIVKTSWINLSVDSFIINNQIMDAQFPVILAPNKKKLNENQQFIMAFIQTKTTIRPPAREPKDKLEINLQPKDLPIEMYKDLQISSLTYVEQMKIMFDSMEVRIEDLLIEALYDFYLEISPALNNIEIKEDLKMATPFDIRTLETKLEGRLKQNNNRSKQMVYIKGMLLHPIEICFSFRDNPGQQKNSLMRSWGSYLGISFISIDSAKIKLGLLDQLHFFGSWDELLLKISKHYKKYLWNQLKKLFFSMDILGNPYSLGESVAVGLKEIVFNPMQDLVKLKFDKFGKGIALGSVGFVKNTLTSVYTSLERILGTIMKTFSKMTRDREYLYGRQIMKNRAIKRVREGVYMGVKNLLKVNADVVIGIPRLIGNEMRQNGCFLGIVIGLYDVVASAILKPVVSFYDLLTSIIEGIKNSDKYEGHIMEIRSRPPRIFNMENLVVPYDYNPAILKLLIMKYKLREIDSEKVEYFDEFTVFNRDVMSCKNKETIYQVILTDYRLLFAEKMSAIFCKKISLHKIQDIHYDKKHKEFILKFQVPIQKRFCCRFIDNDFKMPIGDLEKAKALGKVLKKLRQKGELEFKNKEKDKDEGKIKVNIKENLENIV